LGRAPHARSVVLAGHAATTRPLPHAAARARPARPRRALQLPRRRGCGPARPRARRTARHRSVRRRNARHRANPLVRHVAARARMTYFADVGALARKDLTLELRARDTLPAMLLFVLATLVVFHFVLPPASSDLAAKGLVWVGIVFTALLGLTRAFAPEREDDAIDGLILATRDRSAIWLGKACAVFVFLALAELVALPAFALFFTGVGGGMIVGVLLADVGFCAVGTLLAAMATASRAREL